MEKCKVKNLFNSTDDLWQKQRIPIRRTWSVFDLPWTLPVKGDNRNLAAISHLGDTAMKQIILQNLSEDNPYADGRIGSQA